MGGSVTKSYQYAPSGERLDQIVHNTDGSEDPTYYTYNAHTDVQAITDATGNTKGTYGYTAYGADDTSQDTGVDKNTGNGATGTTTSNPYNVYRFNAKRIDTDTGNYDMGFRTYDPGLNPACSTTKLATRLSKGEKRNRKRLAEVGAVYDIQPVTRTPADILDRADGEPAEAPVAANKWLTASVTEDAASVLASLFNEACRRDPEHGRTWIALVDGNNHQIDRIQTEATRRGAEVTILCDFIHVLEYLWKAAWSFHDEGDIAAEKWVRDKAIAVLQGKATRVAAEIRRTATRRELAPPARAGADVAATYLTNKASYLDYPTALHNGWPIATGVIEGACRHLVKDRMDITGARWGLSGAEAILKLRALRSNGHFNEYWAYHLAQERQRTHETRYHDGIIPQAA